MNTVHTTQQTQQSGKTKLTAVTISSNGKSRQFFVDLVHNDLGEAILPSVVLYKLLDEMGVGRGQTFTVG